MASIRLVVFDLEGVLADTEMQAIKYQRDT